MSEFNYLMLIQPIFLCLIEPITWAEEEFLGMHGDKSEGIDPNQTLYTVLFRVLVDEILSLEHKSKPS